MPSTKPTYCGVPSTYGGHREETPGTVAGLRHRRHHDAMLWAAHPRRVRLQERPYPAQVQRPPPATSLAPVIAGNTPPTDPTPPPADEVPAAVET